MTGTIIPPGQGQTPGFWKNHIDDFEQATGYSAGTSYEAVFGVDVKGTPTLQQALSAKGGGEAELLRASTAALANASGDELDFNFVYWDTSVKAGITEAYNLDPASLTYQQDWWALQWKVLPTMFEMDLDEDWVLSADEIIWAVQDVYDDPDAITDNFSPSDMSHVAKVLDVMNNMADPFLF